MDDLRRLVSNSVVKEPFRAPLPMLKFSEKEFDRWLAAGYQRTLRLWGRPAWLGHRVIGAAGGREMLLARVPLSDGVECVYGEFRPDEHVQLRLAPQRRLLLTFYIEGDLQGFDGAPRHEPLRLAPHTILLRLPNERYGSTIELPPGGASRFFQIRLEPQVFCDWLKHLEWDIGPVREAQLFESNGAAIYRGAWTASTYASLQPWRSVAHLRVAILPFLRAKGLEMLTLFSAEFAARSDPEPPRLNAAQRVAAARAMFEANLSRPWTIPDVARQLGCGPTALKSAFRQETGEGMHAAVLHLRLQRAHQLLTQPTPRLATVADIASSVGFGHAGRFSRAFHAAYGRMPGEFLKPADMH
jgi:AraC-like DNA-binding protein